MTRIRISVGILLLLVIASMVSGIWVNIGCGRHIDTAYTVEELSSRDRQAEAVDAAKKLESDWANFRSFSAVIVKNNKLAEIDRVCTRISYYAENGSDDLVPELIELRNMLGQLRDGETPKPTTVL